MTHHDVVDREEACLSLVRALDQSAAPSTASDTNVLAHARQQLDQPLQEHRSPRWALPVGLLAAMVVCAGIYAQMAQWIAVTGFSDEGDSNIVTRLNAPIVIELLPERQRRDTLFNNAFEDSGGAPNSGHVMGFASLPQRPVQVGERPAPAAETAAACTADGTEQQDNDPAVADC